MGNRNSAIYNDILSEFERDENLLVIQSSIKTEAKVYSKKGLNLPCKVEVMCEVIEGQPSIFSFSKSFQEVIKILRDQLIGQQKIIEYFAGKNSLKNDGVFEKISKDLERIPFFDADGIYRIVHTFQPFIIMQPGFYSVEYYVVTTKKATFQQPQPQPQPDIYGKI